MKRQILTVLAAAALVLRGSAGRAADTNALNQLEQEAAQRTRDYETGSDIQRDHGLYQTNYASDAFWTHLWQRGGANSDNWYQQIRILKIHLEESIQRLRASLDWITKEGELYGQDRRTVVIQRQYSINYTYAFSALINGDTLVAPTFSMLAGDLRTSWKSQMITDPQGRFIDRDFSILNMSTRDASAYLLAHARDEEENHPDSSLFNLLITDDGAAQATSNLNSRVSTDISISDNQLSNPSYDAALRNMQSASTVIPPDATQQPSDIVRSLRAIFSNGATDPRSLRSAALNGLYGDLLVGRFQGMNYAFIRPVRHSSIYYTALNNYRRSVNLTISHYQRMADLLNTQLQQAYQRDRQMLGMVASYRAERERQLPVSTVISSSQARQIFENEVGNMNLTSIPLLSMAQYLIYEIGPPWANTTGWTVPFGYIPNPLYYTITAQLIRGLEGSAGQVYTGTQTAMNAFKNQSQQEEAVNNIQDLETKKADLAVKQEEKEESYGDKSYRINIQELPVTDPRMPLLNHRIDPLTEATMFSADQARQNSQRIADQNKIHFQATTGEGTLIERSGLRTVQEAGKAQALDDLGRVVNNRTVFRASDRNLQMQQQLEQEQINRTLRRIPGNE